MYQLSTGQSVLADCPECSSGVRYESLMRASGITRLMDFKDYHATTSWQRMARRSVAHLIVGRYKVCLVLLYGPSGAGKTHLAVAALHTWIKAGKYGRIIRCREWVARYKARLITTGPEMFERLTGVPFLVLDDLAFRTEFENDTFDEIVCARYEKGYPTLVTTNLDLPEMTEKMNRVRRRASDPIYGRTVMCSTTNRTGAQ